LAVNVICFCWYHQFVLVFYVFSLFSSCRQLGNCILTYIAFILVFYLSTLLWLLFRYWDYIFGSMKNLIDLVFTRWNGHRIGSFNPYIRCSLKSFVQVHRQGGPSKLYLCWQHHMATRVHKVCSWGGNIGGKLPLHDFSIKKCMPTYLPIYQHEMI
jgi:hypothetical protein